MPRAGLTPQRVVDEAAAVADDLGFDQLTLTAVAERVGVAVPSLYKHIGGLADLRHRVAVDAVRGLGRALATAVEAAAPDQRLAAMATAYRGYATAYPGRYAATVQAPEPEDRELLDATEQVLQTVLAVLGGYGFEGEDAVDAARTVRSAVHGFVALEAAGGFGLPRDVDRSFERLVATLDRGIRTSGAHVTGRRSRATGP